MTVSLAEVQDRYETIMRLPEGTERDKALSALMDFVQREFSVPLMEDIEWDRKNPSVIAMYRKISISRSILSDTMQAALETARLDNEPKTTTETKSVKLVQSNIRAGRKLTIEELKLELGIQDTSNKREE